MALLNPYCAIAQLESEIKNASLDATAAEDAINAASRFIDRYKGRDYFEHDHTATAFRVKPYSELVYGDKMFAPYGRIVSVTAITESGVALTEDEDYIPETEYIYRIGLDWQLGIDPEDHILLTGTFGYDQSGDSTAVPTGLPEWLTRACVLIAAAFTGQNKQEIVGLDGQKEEVIDKAIPKTARDLLGTRNKLFV